MNIAKNRLGTSPRRRRRAWTSMLSAALLVGGILGTAAPANAVLTGDICEFAVIITVRGTNAPAGSGSAHDGRLYSSGGHGSELDQVPIFAAGADPSYYVAALNYTASGVDYPASVSRGVQTLVQELNWLGSQCGQYPPRSSSWGTPRERT